MTEGRILSVRTGRVRELERPEWDHDRSRTWHSAYYKDEVAGPVRVTALGLEGDQQYDRAVHGGVEQAVLMYADSNYALWHAEPGRAAMGPGAFGENLTVESLDEAAVCIGDVWETDQVRFEVSQPRGPCANIARRWNDRGLLRRVTETARAGWYLRVTREGSLERGQRLRRIERPYPEWTVLRVFRLKTGKGIDPAEARALSECAALSPEWREHFAELAVRAR